VNTLPTSRRAEGGFALLVMLGVLGMGSLSIVLAVQAFVAPAAERAVALDERLAIAQSAVRVGYRRQGAFPASLDAAATAGSLPLQDSWRLDPFGHAQDFGYVVTAAGVTLRSRGDDTVLNTADDVTFGVPAEAQLRARQRGRLRILRAQLLRSQYRDSTEMNASARAQMRTAMRTVAVNTRRWLTATAAERTVLGTQTNAAGATIASMAITWGLPPLPPSLTGAGGLMQMLGTADSRAVDGAGNALRTDANLGMAARGADLAGGTDDDM
jgi:hypothetical protein